MAPSKKKGSKAKNDADASEGIGSGSVSQEPSAPTTPRAISRTSFHQTPAARNDATSDPIAGEYFAFDLSYSSFDYSVQLDR